MKTKKAESKPTTAKLSHYPAISQGEANQAFVKSVKKPDDGSNSYLWKFLTVAEHVMGKPTFTFQDVLYCAQPFEIPAEETKHLFEVWTDKMVALNKLEVLQGAYEDPIYIVL